MAKINIDKEIPVIRGDLPFLHLKLMMRQAGRKLTEERERQTHANRRRTRCASDKRTQNDIAVPRINLDTLITRDKKDT